MSLYDKKEIMDKFIHNNIFGKLKDEVTVNICTFKYLCGLNVINIDDKFATELKFRYGINIISSNKLENIISYGIEDSKSDFIEFNISEDKPNKSKNKRNIEVSIKSTLTHSSFDKNKTSINSTHSIICDNIKIEKDKYYYIIIIYNGLLYGTPYIRVFDNNPFESKIDNDSIADIIFDIYSKDCVYNSIHTKNLSVSETTSETEIIGEKMTISDNLDKVNNIINRSEKETLENPDGPITKYTAENGLSAVFETEVDQETGDEYTEKRYYIKDIPVYMYREILRSKSGKVDIDPIMDFLHLPDKMKVSIDKSEIPSDIISRFDDIIEYIFDKNKLFITLNENTKYEYFAEHYNNNKIYLCCITLSSETDDKDLITLKPIVDQIFVRIFDNKFGAIYFDSINPNKVMNNKITILDFENGNIIFDANFTEENINYKKYNYSSDICNFSIMECNGYTNTYSYNSEELCYHKIIGVNTDKTDNIIQHNIISNIFSNDDEFIYLRDTFGVPYKYYLNKR